ncbi:MAG: Ubiquinone/menaquinone biosynthesis C-methyltransferase UbiE [Candidatus Argoarchaeum ethanivorans]|uniref:Ubiquinone/menaquinone biosynthesis C-methyltransferase UbiE n=1 Tax=Candidatus Argoarchaeum ethanivorans TaxID=2608793 RepID=A0A812A1E8_9EURY|nr:MAG: Ubiquinone/menaquinone biosynthesis C-methyltransferase UbiE [Candidatus Argoarchaeum ethanivorans]
MKEIINKFWSKDADNYSKSAIRSMHSTKEKKGWQEIFTEVFGKEKLNVLDVGTGPGIIAFLLAELGHDVTGVDLSEEMLRKAMENATHFDLSVEFTPGDAENLPFEDGSFDAVVNRHVLWTLPNPEKAIAEWRRVLKTGGKIVIVDGNWYLNLEFRSLNRRVRGVLAMILVLITERKDLRKSGSYCNVEKKLWSTNKKRPDTDIEILENLGFKDIIVREGINRRTYPFLENLKRGYWGDTFLVSGVKQ